MAPDRALSAYRIEIFREAPVDPEDDNVDVYVHFEDGRSYIATFFTLRNIQNLMEKDRRTGENDGGAHFWATDMVIVRRLDPETVRLAVEDIIAHGA